MEKIKSGSITYLPMLQLDRADIEEIDRIFQTNFKSTEIIADGYRYKSIKEMFAAKSKKFANFRIKGDGPGMYFETSNCGAKIHLTDRDNTVLLGVQKCVEVTIGTKKSWRRFFTGTGAKAVVYLTAFSGIWFFVDTSLEHYLICAGLWNLLIQTSGLFAIRYLRTSHFSLNLERIRRKSTFLRLSRDKMMATALGLIFTSALNWLCGNKEEIIGALLRLFGLH